MRTVTGRSSSVTLSVTKIRNYALTLATCLGNMCRRVTLRLRKCVITSTPELWKATTAPRVRVSATMTTAKMMIATTAKMSVMMNVKTIDHRVIINSRLFVLSAVL